ncbi:MAG TPA: hypothetical protein VGF59_19700 [Bryobacteraceae bacterium]
MNPFAPRWGRTVRLLSLLLGAVMAATAQQPPTSGGIAPSTLKQMSLEDLANIEVTSAGKKEEKLSNVAVALYVIM